MITFIKRNHSSISEHSNVVTEIGEGVTLPIWQGRATEGDDNDDDFNISISLSLFTSSFCNDDNTLSWFSFSFSFWFWFFGSQRTFILSWDDADNGYAVEVEIKAEVAVEIDSFNKWGATIEDKVEVEVVWEKEEA